jgi:hypothetical protein
MSERDTGKEADLLARINCLVVNGRPLAEWEEWQRFQQPLLFADIPGFYARQGPNTPPPARRLGTALAAFAALAVTAYAGMRMLIVRPRVFIFAIDKTSDPISGSDVRIRAVYEAVRETGVSYIECFHTTFDEVIRGMRARRRAALYLESLDLLWRARSFFVRERVDLAFGPLPEGTEEEHAFMRAIVTRYLSSLPRHAFRARLLAALLARARPRIAFLVDDTRHYYDAVAALKAAGVPSYAVQHGQFSARHVGWRKLCGRDAAREHPDGILVWNEHWKRELAALDPVFPQDAIIVGGNPTPLAPLRRKRDLPLVILVPFESEGPYEIMQAVMTRLREGGGTILFKPRPDWPLAEQLARYGLPRETACATDLDAHAGAVSLALGTYTTLLYELAARGLPVALLTVRGVPENPIAERGLADAVSPADPDLVRTLARLALVSDAVLRERRDRLRAPYPLARTIASLITTHALPHP